MYVTQIIKVRHELKRIQFTVGAEGACGMTVTAVIMLQNEKYSK